MCSYGNKLVIFGGHSIREDEHDNEILCSYSLDEISVFNSRLCVWSTLHADTDEEEDKLTVSDMSASLLHFNPIHGRIFILAAQKPAEVHRWKQQASQSSSSEHQEYLPRILESHHSDSADGGEESDGSHSNNVDGKIEVREPNGSEHSENVRKLFKTLDTDLQNEGHRPILERRRRPSLNVISNHEETKDGLHAKRDSTSSHSSSSNDSLGKRKTRHQRRATPCTVTIDLLE